MVSQFNFQKVIRIDVKNEMKKKQIMSKKLCLFFILYIVLLSQQTFQNYRYGKITYIFSVPRYTFFYINNQKFTQSPRKFLIC